jgi:hypothetical protein
LTLACQQPQATTEQRARLERLLSDNPHAISRYLEIVDDTLTLRDASAATVTASAPSSPEWFSEMVARPSELGGSTSSLGRRRSGLWLVAAAVACGLFVLITAPAILQPADEPESARSSSVDRECARVVDLSGVEWADGAQHYDEWGLVKPGESLKLMSGWINLFFPGGAELLIEGPADIQLVSSTKVIARQGKLAARVGPGAIGFRIDTPHAKVIDRGTSFGVSVSSDSHTSVVVYEGVVDLDVIGDRNQRRRRLTSGEALSVDDKGQLSRITTVQSVDFLEPPKVHVHVEGAASERIITAVTDNVRSSTTAKYYRVMPRGFREDCQAYVDRMHQWNGVDARGLPQFLVGGDYVMTFNDDKIVTEIEMSVELRQPAILYVLIDDRVTPPEWLKADFVDTNWDIGSDEYYSHREDFTIGSGAGKSIDHTFSVWQRKVPDASTVVLGPLTYEKTAIPAQDVEKSMYGIVATPLR